MAVCNCTGACRTTGTCPNVTFPSPTAPDWYFGWPFDAWRVSPPANPGWVCPACGRGNAPWKSHCDCGPRYTTVSDDTIGDISINWEGG